MGAKDVSIYLDVQAKALFDGGSIEDNCQFSDDNNGRPKRPLKEFETEIYLGKFLAWEIRLQGSENNRYKIKKIIVAFRDNKSPFNDLIIERNTFKLKEKIKDSSSTREFKYDFEFELELNQEAKPYKIDPKLRINPNPIDN